MPTEIAPLLLFTYNRPEVLATTIQYLQQNTLAPQTELFIFSDGAKNDKHQLKVAEVRKIIRQVEGFKEVHILESSENKGLAQSIISGVSKIIETYGSVIVLEDDLKTAPNFLCYMNQCLAFYKNNPAVASVAGYAPPLKQQDKYHYDAFMFPRNCSHGWATWQDRWGNIDWSVSDYEEFAKDVSRQRQFNEGGSDLSGMLKKQMAGTIDSWSIRFCYHQFKTNTLTVYPVVSKVVNNGFGAEATNTNTYNRYHTHLDSGNKTCFHLPLTTNVDKNYAQSFKVFYSIRTRIIGRIKTYLYWIGIIKNSY